nr:MAG TPA: hypothetical protein [Caudoviricetes sp.]
MAVRWFGSWIRWTRITAENLLLLLLLMIKKR